MDLQETVNDIGLRMRALHARCDATNPDLGAMAAGLHNALALGFVNFIEPLGADWNQAAGIQPNDPKGGAQTNAGVKTKPTADAAAFDQQMIEQQRQLPSPDADA